MSRPDANPLPLQPLALRLLPGDDLRRALERQVAASGIDAAFVLAGIGSLRPARLRMAGATDDTEFPDDLELLTLSGTIAAGGSGSHLHLSVSDASGRVVGGHAAYGCIVRTTAEILLAILPGWHLSRQTDAATGWLELVVRHPGA